MRQAPLLAIILLPLALALAADEDDVVELSTASEEAAVEQASPGDESPDLEAPDPSLDAVASLIQEGFDDLAEAEARAVAAVSEGRTAAAAWLAAGVLAARAERHDDALAAYAEVEALDGPLRPWASWFRAEHLSERGDWEQAADACATYIRSWPLGSHRLDCVRVEAMAAAHLGDAGRAEALAIAWEREVDHASILEPIQLTLAAWEVDHAPEAAVDRLHILGSRFTLAGTPDVAGDLLGRLAARGVADAELPDDTASLKSRAISLRDTGRLDEAWSLYTELEAHAADDPALAAWVEDERALFEWRCRRWQTLVVRFGEAYRDDVEPDTAWYAFRAASRGGLHTEALEWATEGLARHAGNRHWRRGQETLARELLVAGDHERAVRVFDDLADKRGSTGRRNRYYAAFAAMRAGRSAEALDRFDAMIDDGDLETECRYWRGRLLQDEDRDAAARDFAWILDRDPGSWYATLLRDRRDGPDGLWPDRDALAWQIAELAGGFGEPAGGWMAAGLAPSVYWTVPGAVLPEPVASLVPPRDPDHPEHFTAFAQAWGEHWPELHAIDDLARAGLEELSGPAFRAWRIRWLDEHKRRGRAARDLGDALEYEDWMALYAHTGDHYDRVRNVAATVRIGDPRSDVELRRAGLPLAYRRVVWQEAARWGVDPLLVLALMRTESIYDPYAVSRVGARGPMQVMPKTGSLVARLVGDATFSAGDLHDPEVAVRYGVRYLAMLLRRFDGVVPLAVASYNGGPHNVSSWLKGTGMDVPMDVFVDSIPFGETRRYVRKVMSTYATYVQLYRPDAPPASIAATPRADRPEVVDF